MDFFVVHMCLQEVGAQLTTSLVWASTLVSCTLMGKVDKRYGSAGTPLYLIMPAWGM